MLLHYFAPNSTISRKTPTYFSGTFPSFHRPALSLPNAATPHPLSCTNHSLFCISEKTAALFSMVSALFCSLQGVWGIHFSICAKFPSSYDVTPSNSFPSQALRTLSCATDGYTLQLQNSRVSPVAPTRTGLRVSSFVFRFSSFAFPPATSTIAASLRGSS